MRPRPKPLDVVLAGLCVPATIAGTRASGESFGGVEVAVIVVSVALVLLRHYAPIPVLAAAIGAAIASVAVMDHPNVLIGVVVLVVFTAAAEHDRRTGVQAGLAGLAGLLVVVAIQNSPDHLPGPLLAAVAWPALAFAAGDLLRTRRETILAADERARRAEESREEEARRRVAEERLHIARELHDVVAHRMAVVNVQAGVAEHLLRPRPDDAEAALRIVRSSAQAALDDLGSILNLLRSAGAGDDSVEPAPTLTELTALIDSYRDAGLAVEYETSGAPRPLPDTTQLALYRTVQEALTNAHKHGDGHVRLRIGHAADGVAVELVNTVAVPSERGRRRGGLRADRHARARTCRRRVAARRSRRRRQLRRPRPLPGRRGAPMTIRVVLADDQALMRSGFRVLIDSAEDLEVVGEAATGDNAVRLARSTRADVVLMDIRMPGTDGIAATRAITEDDDLAGVKVVVLTTFETDAYVIEAVRAGASGFLSKSIEPADLLDAIRTVAGGDALLSPKATQALLAEFATAGTAPAIPAERLADLTAREREMMTLAAHGLSNDQIAERLFLSPLTVKTHINRAMMKLAVRDRAQLVVLAYQSGLVRPGDRID